MASAEINPNPNNKLDKPSMKFKIKIFNNQDHPDEKSSDLELLKKQKAAEKVMKFEEDDVGGGAAAHGGDDELEEGEIRDVEDDDDDDVDDDDGAGADDDENQELPAEIKDVKVLHLQNNLIKAEGSSSEVALDDEKARLCHQCDRMFKNGKALGGHRRSCNAKKAGLDAIAGPSPGPKVVGVRCGAGGLYKCELCDKEFVSEKSLYGHMRKHPDRPWRGMHPPREIEPKRELPSSSRALVLVSPVGTPVGGSPLGSPVGSLVNSWRSKGRRGRTGGFQMVRRSSPGGSTSSGHCRSSSEELAAAELMRMCRERKKPKLGENPNHVQVIRKGYGKHLGYDSDELYYLKGMGDLGNDDDYDSSEGEDSDEADQRAESNLINDVEVDEKVVEEEEDMVDEEPEPPLILLRKGGGDRDKMKKEYKKNANGKRLRDVDGDRDHVEEGVKFRCTTCNKTFVTHQALGGHRSGHNKEKSNPNTNNHHHGNYSQNFQGGTKLKGGGVDIVKSPICSKTYASGEALGGQLRSHDYSPEDEQSSDGDQISGDMARRRGNVIDLDLNRSPQQEGDDEIVQSKFKGDVFQ